MKTSAKIVSAAKTSASHLIVEALAGTGKTTTLIQGLRYVLGEDASELPNGDNIVPSPQQAAVWDAMAEGKKPSSIIFVAFNRLIADELKKKVPAGCDAMTMHSMGGKIVRNNFDMLPGYKATNQFRTSNIIEELHEGLTGKHASIWDLKKNEPEFLSATEKLVNLCKLNLCDGSSESLEDLCSHYSVELNGTQEKVFQFVPAVLERAKDVTKDRTMDFADMIWLPVVLDLPFKPYDLLLWDEAQDGNRCQQALAKKCGKRLLLCGDRFQAIYGFAGADATAMDRMEDELSSTKIGVKVLPLTVTRRCGSEIVKDAREIVPNFEAHPDNGTGKVSTVSFKEYRTRIEDKDMILCRVNAPLVSECFKLLRKEIKANIQGRDVGQGLIATIKRLFKAEARSSGILSNKDWDKFFPKLQVTDLIGYLSNWEHNEVAKEQRRRNPSELKIASIQDRSECVQFFAEGATLVSEIVESINRIFTDKEVDGVLLSSIHKAKGLEANRVFLIEPEGATVPHPMAKMEWEVEQEWNLRYVAITRAIEELVYVTGKV